MPELPEVESYRTLAEHRALGRVISAIAAPDAWYLKRGVPAAALSATLVGSVFARARRIGKLLLLDVAAGEQAGVLGLRFGMSGRLVIDGVAGVDDLLYSSNRPHEPWDRFVVQFADGGDLRMRDPRRLGGVEWDPDVTRLGPDARGVSLAALRAAIAGSRAPVKARLMDQAHLAGVGNLIADETFWRAAIDPRREARSLSVTETRRLHRHLVRVIDDLIARGGSHMGDFLPHRAPGGRCPRDGTALATGVVGGRTTWWCPKHQR